MKKALFLLLLGALGFAVWRQVENQRLEADLWTEATEDRPEPAQAVPAPGTAVPVDLR